jgi:hypothetical protein
MSTVIKLIPEQPTLASIFNDGSIRHEPTLFSPAELDALERGLFYKKDKPYLVCAATDKERPAKPEEIVRQLWLRRLMENYGYHRNRIGVEHGVHFGREVKRADAVIFDADRPDAEHFQPKYNALFSLLAAKSDVRLGDCVVEPIRRGISLDYVEEGGDLRVINTSMSAKPMSNWKITVSCSVNPYKRKKPILPARCPREWSSKAMCP